MSHRRVVILGAGPAGLASAYELVQRGIKPVVLEKADKVGGIARTETYKGYHFDIGGHRFFTKNRKIDKLWHEMLGEDFLTVPRLSRIYYQDRFFNYPLNLHNTLCNLGVIQSLLILCSYLRIQLSPYPQEETFEQWVSNRFGRRLYRTFFQTYTEKVWGIPCSEIRADWAAQRIKGLSLAAAVINALLGAHKAKSLIDEFNYPLRGPGMMWQRFQEEVEVRGGEVFLNSEAVILRHENGHIKSVTCYHGKKQVEIPVKHLISSVPINRLVAMLEPKVPSQILDAARKFSYRAFLIVGLIVEKERLFPDQWIYVHSPDVKVGRIQNFKNWSAAMVPDPKKTSVGMEYFCSESDEVWTLPNADLIDLASQELSKLGLVNAEDIRDGFVMRQTKAYPVYDQEYGKNLETIRNYIGHFDNLQTVGRNGMHRYNNMDHSMHTGMLAAQNILDANHNLWEVNEEEEYLEEDKEMQSTNLVPARVFKRAFARMDKLAFAVAVGSISGLLSFLAIIWLMLKGQGLIDKDLLLFSNYSVNYSVAINYVLVISCQYFIGGFLYGWLFAYLRNFFIAIYIFSRKRKTEFLSITDFFDEYRFVW